MCGDDEGGGEGGGQQVCSHRALSVLYQSLRPHQVNNTNFSGHSGIRVKTSKNIADTSTKINMPVIKRYQS